MANATFKDAAGDIKYAKTTGAGSAGDPNVGHVNVDALPVGVKVAAQSLSTTHASDDALLVAMGATSDPAIVTDANGSVSGKLRGFIVLLLAMSAKLPASVGIKTAAASLSVTSASDDVAATTIGTTSDATIKSATASGTLSSKLRGLVEMLFDVWDDAANALRVDTGVVTIVGYQAKVSQTFARPANATPYTAGDVVSNNATTTVLMAFDNMARANAGGGTITHARLVTDLSTCTARFRVHIYNTSAPTVSGDNVAGNRIYANRDIRLGSFDLPAMTTGAGGSNTGAESESDTVRKPYVTAAADDGLYCVLETLDAFTPASGQNFHLYLDSDLY